jgi:anaerobic selenocysteine-containing dehydrogenase
MLFHAGNPILSLPNGKRLERALDKLEFSVAIDIYKNETTRHAHLILPTTFGLEHDQYGLLPHALAVRNFARYARPLVKKPEGLYDSWEIMIELSARIWSKRSALGRIVAPVFRAIMMRFGARGLLDLLLRFGPHRRALASIEREAHGVDLGPLVPRLDELVRARGRKMDLLPEPLVRDLDRLNGRLGDLATPKDPSALLLIGRRQLRSNNSWMHNSRRLVKGKNRCTLLMHPSDAAARGIDDKKRVRVTSKVGAIEIEVEISDEIMPGVVSIPHGWGHDRAGAELRIAGEHAGVSINDLTDETHVDPVSGCTSFSNIEVSVR